MSTEPPLAGYGTHLRKSRDLLLIERDEARVAAQMADHTCEKLREENANLREALALHRAKEDKK